MRRYAIQARRKDIKQRWSEWTYADDYGGAKKHADYIEKVGYEARIVDRGADNEQRETD